MTTNRASERAYQLRDAIVDMAARLSQSSLKEGMAFSNGRDEHDGKSAQYWSRASQRQFAALQRISAALRDMAVTR